MGCTSFRCCRDDDCSFRAWRLIVSMSGLRFVAVRFALLLVFLTLLGFAVAQSAFIQVRAAVGIQVFVDDVFVGVTNADVGGLIVSDVRVGLRRLRFVLEGFLPQDQTVTMAAGQVLLVEVGSLVPRVQVREEGAGGAAELRVETGSVVVQCLPIECVVDVPALGITNRRKTQDRLVIEGVPVGTYAGRLTVGSVAFPVSFEVCGDDTTALFGTFVGATPGVTVTSAAGLGVGCSRSMDASLSGAPTYVSFRNVRSSTAGGGTPLVSFDVSWPESWRGPTRPSWVAAADNWDAAWVFLKYRVDDGEWRHATLAAGGHVAPSGVQVDVPADRMGAFVYRADPGYGVFDARGVGLVWDATSDRVPAGARVEVQPFAVEMVFVPQGAFSLGSGGNATGEFRAGGSSNAPFVVSSQSSISLGSSAGQLNWTAGGSSGSPSSSTNASFPTGYGAFYVMKYQVTQGEYVNFLNTLTQSQANERKYTGSESRYAITGDRVGSYATSLPFVAANYMSWADGAAFADWAGLRPMTELEFEKAARGPLSPVANEFAWGSTSITQVTGLANAGSITEMPTPSGANANYRSGGNPIGGPVRVGSFAAPGRSREQAGAGYFGALELSGNLWERPVTVGNAEGRAFTGAHGDGALDAGGNANVTSWPGSDAVGAGFRGGGWRIAFGDGLRVSDRYLAAHAFAIAIARRVDVSGWRGARSAP
jgi:formylglycine-generating enzyme required for sulfatase activity